MPEVYFCMSSSELSLKDLIYLSQEMKCEICPVAKVKGQNKRDYLLHKAQPLSEKDFAIAIEKGLTILLTPNQRKTVPESIVRKFDENIRNYSLNITRMR